MIKLRICFVGDSVTSGQGDIHYFGWPGRVGMRECAAGSRITVYNLGIRLDTSQDMAARWKAEADARLPADLAGALVFAFGINDCTEESGRFRVDLLASLDTARAMVAEASRSRPCLWVGPTPVDESSQPSRMDSGELRTKRNAAIFQYSEAYAELSLELGVPYLDLFSPLHASSDWVRTQLADGVHSNEAGYQAIAEHFCRWKAWRELLAQ